MRRTSPSPTLLLAALLIATLPVPLRLSAQEPVHILVSAAASLQDALNEIIPLYEKTHPNVRVTLNLGGSGTLGLQIEQGAPADVFIAASPQSMDPLEVKGLLLSGTRINVLENRLVLVVPKGTAKITGFRDLTRADVRVVAMGDREASPRESTPRKSSKRWASTIPCAARLNSTTQQWNLAYTLQNGLELGVPYTVPGFPTRTNAATGLPWSPATDGLRNLIGTVDGWGHVTIWAITSTISGDGDTGADPDRLVVIEDSLNNTDPTVAANEKFYTLRTAGFGEVLRGISFAPGTDLARSNW